MNIQFEGDKVIMDKSDFMKLISGTEIRESVNGCKEFSDSELITSCLDKKGFRRNIKGFNYLRSAILKAVNDPKILSKITLELYPGIAEEFGDKPERVERAMRHAITTVYGELNKPTNGAFIALMADEIRIRKEKV